MTDLPEPRVQGLATITVRVATPSLLARGLSLIGIGWEPKTDVGDENGLYMWVVKADGVDPLHRGGIYLGVADRATVGALRERTDYEESYRGGVHGHGRAIGRTEAVVVGGPLTWDPNPDLSFVEDAIARDVLTAPSLEPVRQWVREHQGSIDAAERFAIRLALHLGDIGSAVNSRHGSAWEMKHPVDWAAFAVSEEMVRRWPA